MRDNMRTQDEIVERLKNNKNTFLSFLPEILVPYLDLEHAKPFLKPEAKVEEWAGPVALSDDGVKESMREYMARVGWDKVENHRGISAGRTVI